MYDTGYVPCTYEESHFQCMRCIHTKYMMNTTNKCCRFKFYFYVDQFVLTQTLSLTSSSSSSLSYRGEIWSYQQGIGPYSMIH